MKCLAFLKQTGYTISRLMEKLFMSPKQSKVMRLRAFKLITVCLFVLCLQVSGKGYAQIVTLSVRNVPLQKVFREITRQTCMSIVYKEALLEGMAPVSIEVKNAKLEEVLNDCLK